jgi:hypothetical protein
LEKNSTLSDLAASLKTLLETLESAETVIAYPTIASFECFPTAIIARVLETRLGLRQETLAKEILCMLCLIVACEQKESLGARGFEPLRRCAHASTTIPIGATQCSHKS